MFTGIVATTAPIVAINEKQQFRTLILSFEPKERAGLEIGASVANNGVCLTVTRVEDDRVFFDVMEETLLLTNLADVKIDDRINIERSLVYGKEVGGHVVSGHIHTKATITAIERTETNCNMRLSLPPKWMKYILHKGFIAVDGCSLTVGDTFDDGFNLYLIPETLERTTLGTRQVGDELNIEIDSQTQAIVDTVERVLADREKQNAGN